MEKKKPYQRVRYRDFYRVSPKAAKVICFDGSEDVLPLSQIIEEISDSVLVPVWLAEQKQLQFASKWVWR